MQRDCTNDAEALFKRVADAHHLAYVVAADAAIDLCWHFPIQPGLSKPITLGLQNWDELNFGVDEFWSYFFPFDGNADRFEQIVGAWIAGNARVAVTGKRSGFLQMKTASTWKTVYSQNGCVWFFWQKPKFFLMNEAGI